MIHCLSVDLVEIVSDASLDFDRHVSGLRARRVLAKYESDRNRSPNAHGGAPDHSNSVQCYSTECWSSTLIGVLKFAFCFDLVNQESDLLATCDELKTLLDYLTRYFPFTSAHREAKVSACFTLLYR